MVGNGLMPRQVILLSALTRATNNQQVERAQVFESLVFVPKRADVLSEVGILSGARFPPIRVGRHGP